MVDTKLIDSKDVDCVYDKVKEEDEGPTLSLRANEMDPMSPKLKRIRIAENTTFLIEFVRQEMSRQFPWTLGSLSYQPLKNSHSLV